MSDKLCVIVGAGAGVSLAVARRFGREGYPVALVARSPEKLDLHMKQLTTERMYARVYPADASSPESLAAAFTSIRTDISQPDVLVYNAFASTPGAPSSLQAENVVADFRTNVAGALLAAQQVIPDMQAKGRGTILYTGGGLALYPNSQAASLGVGKAGLRNLVYSLAEELEPAGIHVATVTIAGAVRPGTDFDPERIAEVYWKLHVQPRGQWEREVVYRGQE